MSPPSRLLWIEIPRRRNLLLLLLRLRLLGRHRVLTLLASTPHHPARPGARLLNLITLVRLLARARLTRRTIRSTTEALHGAKSAT